MKEVEFPHYVAYVFIKKFAIPNLSIEAFLAVLLCLQMADRNLTRSDVVKIVNVLYEVYSIS